MSIASKVGQIVYTRQGNVYMPLLQCDKGDLYQEYQGTPESPSNISPDFSRMLPTISYIITSSRAKDGLVKPGTVAWSFNGQPLTFNKETNISETALNGETGHFKLLPRVEGSRNYWGIQILKNLVKASGAAPCNIKAVATVAIGMTSDTIQCIYSIPITKGKSNVVHVRIQAGDNNNFTIQSKNGALSKCILTAVALSGNDEVTANLTYKWYKLNGGQWEVIGSQIGKNITITESMVSTASQFKAEVYQNGSLIGSDVQTVTDLSDPYYIIPNPNPENETIEEGSQGTVVYTPKLVSVNDPTERPMTFYFTFMDSVGNILNPSNNTVASKTGTVTEAMCVQAGGNVSYVITTKD